MPTCQNRQVSVCVHAHSASTHLSTEAAASSSWFRRNGYSAGKRVKNSWPVILTQKEKLICTCKFHFKMHQQNRKQPQIHSEANSGLSCGWGFKRENVQHKEELYEALVWLAHLLCSVHINLDIRIKSIRTQVFHHFLSFFIYLFSFLKITHFTIIIQQKLILALEEKVVFTQQSCFTWTRLHAGQKLVIQAYTSHQRIHLKWRLQIIKTLLLIISQKNCW